ncbi:MAG: hypothetical protein WCO10_02810 [bacterium]
MQNEDQKKFEEIVKKITEMKAAGSIDLSTEEDLAVAVMNLISLEEHMFFTGAKTEKPGYFDLLNEIRSTRTKLMSRMIERTEGEVWCISKHLLATSMRLMEVGTKLQSDGKKDEAKQMFESAYKMFTLFFGIRLKVVTVCEVEQMAKDEKPWTLKDIVTKMVDCCDE